MAALSVPRLAPGIGLSTPTTEVPCLIYHWQARKCIDPVAGVVYGASGTPVGGVCADGYVRLGENGRGYLYAHRLIYEAVHGPIPEGLYVDHKNGCKSDNRISNLEAVTPSENLLRAFEQGLRRLGGQMRHSKLTPSLVRQIRKTIGAIATREWARRLKVDPATVRAVRQGTTWRHVPMRGRLPSRPRWRRQ